MSENKEELENNNVVEENVEETKTEIVEESPTHEELLQKEKDRYLRLFAEFENYKKRTSKERIELFKTASQDLMQSLLPVLDDLNRGVVEAKKVKDKEVLKGLDLISSKLKNTLEQKGLEIIDIKNGDVFDAEIHEAITQIPAPSKKMVGKIIDVAEVGYKLGDKIIRYPKVVVGK